MATLPAVRLFGMSSAAYIANVQTFECIANVQTLECIVVCSQRHTLARLYSQRSEPDGTAKELHSQSTGFRQGFPGIPGQGLALAQIELSLDCSQGSCNLVSKQKGLEQA